MARVRRRRALWYLLAFAFAAMVMVAGGLSSMDPDPDEVSFDAFVAAFEGDPAAATRRFEGRLLRIEGPVDSVSTHLFYEDHVSLADSATSTKVYCALGRGLHRQRQPRPTTATIVGVVKGTDLDEWGKMRVVLHPCSSNAVEYRR